VTGSVQFQGYKSITGGFVAFGSTKGEAGSAFQSRSIWYGCQGETWAELQAHVRKLALRIMSDAAWPELTAVELFMQGWDEETPLSLSPHPHAESMFRHLSTVCDSPVPRVEDLGGIAQVFYLRDNKLLLVLPDQPWKPELESGMIAFLAAVSNEATVPAVQRFGKAHEEIMDETLRGAMPVLG